METLQEIIGRGLGRFLRRTRPPPTVPARAVDEISDFPSGVRFVLDKGRDAVRYKIADPAGYGAYVNPLSNIATVDAAVNRFTTAYNRALKAENYAASGNVASAFEEWRKVFPNYFPSYD